MRAHTHCANAGLASRATTHLLCTRRRHQNCYLQQIERFSTFETQAIPSARSAPSERPAIPDTPGARRASGNLLRPFMPRCAFASKLFCGNPINASRSLTPEQTYLLQRIACRACEGAKGRFATAAMWHYCTAYTESELFISS